MCDARTSGCAAVAAALTCLLAPAGSGAGITFITGHEPAAFRTDEAFVAEGRMGNRSSRGGDWELGLWSPDRVTDQSHFDWTSGEQVGFTLVWDAAAGRADFSLGNGQGARDVSADEPDPIGSLVIRLASYRDGSVGRLDSLTLNGVALDGRLHASGGTASLLLEDATLRTGFSLSGRATFSWRPGDTPRGSQSAFQIKAFHEAPPVMAVPTPTAGSLALVGLGGLLFRRGTRG